MITIYLSKIKDCCSGKNRYAVDEVMEAFGQYAQLLRKNYPRPNL
jgi:hypothetical protein